MSHVLTCAHLLFAAETLWPALFTSSGDSNGAPLGWEMAEGATMTLSLGDDWSGRVWGRTVRKLLQKPQLSLTAPVQGCDFNADVPEYEMCDTGGCNGGFLCDTAAGTGVPPVTLAEITFASTGEDWYDVSVSAPCSCLQCPADALWRSSSTASTCR